MASLHTESWSLRKGWRIHYKYVQRELFPGKIESLMEGRALKRWSSILALSPFVDSSGLLRVGAETGTWSWVSWPDPSLSYFNSEGQSSSNLASSVLSRKGLSSRSTHNKRETIQHGILNCRSKDVNQQGNVSHAKRCVVHSVHLRRMIYPRNAWLQGLLFHTLG